MKILSCYIILLLLSIWVFICAGDNGIINNNDTCFSSFPAEELNLNLCTWYSRTNFGKSNYLNLTILPSFVLRGILDLLGLPVWLINRLWFVGGLFVMGISMFYFTSIFVKKENGVFNRLLSASFFMLNPYVFNRLTGGQIMMLWELASMVYMLGFFIKGLESPYRLHKYAILFAVASLFSGIVIRILAFMVIGLYFLWHIIFHINKLRAIIYSIKFVVVSMIIIFILNCFWILPVLNAGMSNIVSAVYGNTGDWGSLVGTSPFIRIIWVMRLLYGLFTILTPYPKYLISSYGILNWFLLIAFVYSGLLLQLRDKKKYFFYLLAIISTYFATGLNYHISSSVYTWLWNHFSPFQVFRNPEKFLAILLLCYASLMCITLREIALRLVRHRLLKRIFYIFIIVLILANSWIFFTGDLMGDLKSVEIPSYYYELREYLKNNKYERLLSLPIQWLLYNYDWAPYCMGDILYNVSPLPVVSKIPGEDLGGIKEKLLYEYFYRPGKLIPPQLFSFCNVKYTLFHDDLYSEDAVKIRRVLDASVGKEYKSKKVFGKLSLYEVSDRFILPYIYAGNNANWVLSDAEEYGILTHSRIFSNRSILIFSRNSPEKMNNFRIIAFDKYANELKYNGEVIYVFKERKEQKFYAPEDGYYFIKGIIISKFYEKKYVGSKYLFSVPGEIEGWDYALVNITNNYKVDDGSLEINCLFDGNADEDEFVQFKKKIIGIDLYKYPWIGLYYKVNDPAVQTIEIVLGLDFNLDNKVDAHIRGLYSNPASAEWDLYERNVLEISRALYPKEAHYRIAEVEFYPHKLWNVDCSKEKRGEYNFYIKELLFYKKSLPNYILDIDNRLVLTNNYVFTRDIYKIDEKGYSFKKLFLDKKDARENVFEDKIWLKKGIHVFNFEEDSSFTVEWLMIEPAESTLGIGPEIEFTRINPAKYRVKANNVKGAFWLMFNEAFHSGWQAFVKGNKGYKEITNHYRANGYANVWHIKEDQILDPKFREVEILLEFMPQKWFFIGSIISIFGILACFAYFISGRRKTND